MTDKLEPSKTKNKRCSIPLVVDLIEDNMRSRVLFPLAALLLYILLVVNIVNFEETVFKAFIIQVCITSISYQSCPTIKGFL